ncbi:MAG: protein-disulfide reductase DsbD [Gammaproteobacteria bacterium]|nr:protein-disulfide reductase DsbD [Gammaproteobacteria bacterium]
MNLAKLAVRRKISIAVRAALAVAFVVLGLFVAPADAAREVKRPQEVFLYEARTDGDAVIVDWKIAEGYYLYRDKMKLTADGVTFATPQWPAGEVHSDEFFGEQIIYRGNVSIRVPVRAVTTTAAEIELDIVSQGCADFGLCYPPQNWSATVATPVLRASAQLPGSANSGGLAGLITGSDNPNADVLPADQAFVADLRLLDAFTLEVRWDIAPGYYLYRKDFAVSGPDTIRVGKLQLPEGIIENDLEFGEVEVYFNSVVFTAPLSRTPAAQTAEFVLAYQGCKQGSICYPPATVKRSVELPEATAAEAAAAAGVPPVSEQDRLFAVIADGSLLTMMSVFLGLGLLLAFSPCCLPMVPILSGIIAGQGDNITTSRSFFLSLAYVLGMALTYTIAGAIVGAAGGSISAALQTPPVIIFVAALFVVLSLSMFGAYEVQVPAALQTRLTALGSQGKAGSFAGTLFMGAISALVVSTCVAPPLVAALMVIAQTGDVARGALALFALSIGMGIPLLIFGTSAGKLLPKAGPWMDNIKAIFGFMLLGLAVWMLDRILPATVTMALYAALAVFAGVWFGAFRSLPDGASGIAMFGKAISLLLLMYGATLGVGALSGSANPLQPLDRLTGNAPEEHALPFEIVKSVDDFEAARVAAAAEGKTLMLDFYADWCVSCKEMEAWTFTDEQVQAELADTVLLQADVTANDEVDQALLEYFGIFGPPTIVFYDRAGNEIQGQRVIGYMPTDEFLTHLDYVLR